MGQIPSGRVSDQSAEDREEQYSGNIDMYVKC